MPSRHTARLLVAAFVLVWALPSGADDAAPETRSASALPPVEAAPPQSDAALDEMATPDDDAYFDQEGYFEDEVTFEVSDPLEPMNRAVFGLNSVLGATVFYPVSSAYTFLVPAPGRRSLTNFFRNLSAPAVFVNDVIQLRGSRAGVTLSRFLLNSTIGIAGLFDPAAGLGLPRHHADFGQSLYRMGVGSGPYLVIPVFGSSTVRDALGGVVDLLLMPQTYLLGIIPAVAIEAGVGVSQTKENVDKVLEIRKTSVDFYSTVRTLYIQHRATELDDPGPLLGQNQSPEDEAAEPPLPASDEALPDEALPDEPLPDEPVSAPELMPAAYEP